MSREIDRCTNLESGRNSRRVQERGNLRGSPDTCSISCCQQRVCDIILGSTSRPQSGVLEEPACLKFITCLIRPNLINICPVQHLPEQLLDDESVMKPSLIRHHTGAAAGNGSDMPAALQS